MCWRFQIGSNSPLANRKARMLSIDSLPRKWSILKICDSRKTLSTASLSSLDGARSQPNGFSMITRELSVASPDAPSIPTTDANADGGTARWNSRAIDPPLAPWPPWPCELAIDFSAAATAATSGEGSSGDAVANVRCETNFSHGSPNGFATPYSSQADRAWDLKSSSDTANSGGEVPMIANFSGSSPATNRW